MYGNTPAARRQKGKTLLQTIHDVLRELVNNIPWRNETDKVQAHGIINGNDPNFVPAPVSTAQQNLTPEQLQIQQLQAQLAAVTGQANYAQPNAAQQLAAANAGLTPQQYAQQQAAAQPYMGVNPQDMRGYQYPTAPPAQAQNTPVFPQPVRQAQPANQMQQYAYPTVPQQAPPQFNQPQVNPFQ